MEAIISKKNYIPLTVFSGTEGVPTEELSTPRDPDWHAHPRRPEWLRVKLQTSESFATIRRMMKDLKLNTVCQEARCPNIYECWSEGTATFMVMGDTCTRACGFCNVKTGRPEALDGAEPAHVAEAVASMNLEHAVITSVDRDDLPDGGAGHFAATIIEVKKQNPSTKVEVLIPDFRGDEKALMTILEAEPDVLNHNTETVPRLYRRVRNRAKYEWTMELLARASTYRDQQAPTMLTKSGIMLGLGESLGEVRQTIKDIRAQGTDILTVGQYMRPTVRHLPVERFWRPEEFEQIRVEALALGYRFVESGPLVRSSYHAGRHRVAAESAGKGA